MVVLGALVVEVVKEPLVVKVEHLVAWLDVAPVPDAEDPVGVVPILPDTVQLHRRGPIQGQVFL